MVRAGAGVFKEIINIRNEWLTRSQPLKTAATQDHSHLRPEPLCNVLVLRSVSFYGYKLLYASLSRRFIYVFVSGCFRAAKPKSHKQGNHIQKRKEAQLQLIRKINIVHVEVFVLNY